MTDLVAEWLADYDRAATIIPEPRRSALRIELEAHLGEAIPANATDAATARALTDLGDPATIVAAEVDADAPPPAPRRRRRLSPAIVALIVIAAVVVIGVPAILFGLHLIAGATAPRNVVVSHPEGPARTTEGRAYQEYLATIEGLDPLPPGAAWPYGVPVGLDAGPTDDGTGVMAAGAGVVTANMTWGCAWEYEYVLAERAGDDARLVTAYDAIVAYGDSPMMREASPDGGWIANVVAPLEFEDSDGLKRDVVTTCENAGILGLYQLVYHPEGY